MFSYLRWKGEEHLLVVSNFDDRDSYDFELKIPGELIMEIGLRPGRYRMKDALGSTKRFVLEVTDHGAMVTLSIEPLESFILKF